MTATRDELLALAERVERATGPDRGTDIDIAVAVGRLNPERPPHLQIAAPYTASIDAIRSLGGLLVYASDIGADGLAMVKIVADTSTSPIIEHTGIASRLEHAWLAAALRARAATTGEQK